MLAFVITAKQRVNVIDLLPRWTGEIERLDRFAKVIRQGAVLGATALGARDARMTANIFDIRRIFSTTCVMPSQFNWALSLEVVFRPLQSTFAIRAVPFLGLLLGNLLVNWVSPISLLLQPNPLWIALGSRSA
jgi:hypothetical protein